MATWGILLQLLAGSGSLPQILQEQTFGPFQPRVAVNFPKMSKYSGSSRPPKWPQPLCKTSVVITATKPARNHSTRPDDTADVTVVGLLSQKNREAVARQFDRPPEMGPVGSAGVRVALKSPLKHRSALIEHMSVYALFDLPMPGTQSWVAVLMPCGRWAHHQTQAVLCLVLLMPGEPFGVS